MNTPIHVDLGKTTIRESLEGGYAQGNTAFIYNRELTAAELLEAHDTMRGLVDANPSLLASPPQS